MQKRVWRAALPRQARTRVQYAISRPYQINSPSADRADHADAKTASNLDPIINEGMLTMWLFSGE
jgi:hypothetical protein